MTTAPTPQPSDPRATPHANRLRAGRQSAPWQTYFITKCVQDRRPVLADSRAAEVIIASLTYLRRQGQIKLLAFVVMPDHYHTVLTLLPGEDLSPLMRRIGSFTANQIRRLLDHRLPVWQDDGFHDHNYRGDADVLECAEYVEFNPVRKGLVTRPDEWRWSSAHASRSDLLDWDWWRGSRSDAPNKEAVS